MKYDRYEIKKVEHIKASSEETECFNLDLFVDGKKFANVGNDGHGGSHRTHPYPPFNWQDINEVTEQMKVDTFLVPPEFDFEHFDTAVSTLLSLHMTAKEITKGCKKKALYVIDGDLFQLGYQKGAAPDQRLFDHVKEKHPKAVLLNGMDITAAARLILESDRIKIAAMYPNDSPPSTP